ncbi:MAG: O-antigen ligase family protein [Ignavibacterium sp.]|jgi:O-antigen ligase|uniref:O-antigen ligase family protein n=1 Tax=Ignavibacterium sp. TaxID=2651167 RepID=UPI0032981272
MLLKNVYQIRFLLLIQITILGISAYFDFLPFYLLLGIFVLSLLSYYSFNRPYFFNIILLIAILVDALLPIKFKASGPSLLLTEFFLLILTPVIFLRFLLDINKIQKVPNTILIWIPFLIWSLVVGLIVGIDKLRIVSFWKNFMVGLISFSILLIYLNNSKSTRTLFRFIILWGVGLTLLEFKVILDAGGFVSGIIGLFLYKNLLSVGWGKSNYIAAFYVVIIPLTIGYLINTRKIFSKYLLSFSLILMFIAVTLTLSRGGILALMIAVIFLLTKVLKPRYFLSVGAFFVFILIILLLNPLTYVIIDRISTLESSSSVYSRINFYKDVWNTFLEFPLTGVGLGNLGYYSKFILGPELSPSAHNIILGALGELGVFGSIFYLSIFVYIGIKIYNLYRSEQDEQIKTLRWCLISSYLGAIIHTLVEPTLEGLQFSIIFWSTTALNFKVHLIKE